MINYTNIYDVISDYIFVLRGFKRNIKSFGLKLKS